MHLAQNLWIFWDGTSLQLMLPNVFIVMPDYRIIFGFSNEASSEKGNNFVQDSIPK